MEKGFVIWYTGVAASGKSTINQEVLRRLRERDVKIENFDADEVRANISPNLGFTLEARDENTKRLAFFGSILARNGVSASIAAVSSLRRFRDRARSMIDHFVEVYVKCSLDECKKRDPKGLYKKATEGKINDIAGWHQPYEEPLNPELVLDTTKLGIEECAVAVIAKLEQLGYLPATVAAASTETGYSADEEAKVRKRLADLGYL
ncbi:MAG: adenylyl-sulfate kinase [Verrucomicrobia bacterium]|nr:adenylyl-sulfate kinase [Verrucomicrobiota bacterium]